MYSSIQIRISCTVCHVQATCVRGQTNYESCALNGGYTGAERVHKLAQCLSMRRSCLDAEVEDQKHGTVEIASATAEPGLTAHALFPLHLALYVEVYLYARLISAARTHVVCRFTQPTQTQ